MNWPVVLQTVVALLGATGLTKIIDALVRKRAVKVEVADKVNQMTLEWAELVKADAREARKEAAEARKEAEEARKETAEARTHIRRLYGEIDHANNKLKILKSAIFSSATTLDTLRDMVDKMMTEIASQQE